MMIRDLRRSGFAPLVIGHRGAKGYCPENTLSSFRKGLALGADVLECDVHFSRDEQLIVIHDETVDRTTNGFGRVRELSLAELRLLDAGKGERLPTLGELLDWIKPLSKVGLLIEIKMDLSIYPTIGEAVVDAIQTRELVNRTGVMSFDYAVLEEVKDLCSELPTGLLYNRPLADPVRTAQEIHVDSIAPCLELLSRDLVQHAREQGFAVFTWLANTQEQIQFALDFETDGIASDFPDRLRKSVDRRYVDLHRIA